jgi:hypothetical protein
LNAIIFFKKKDELVDALREHGVDALLSDRQGLANAEDARQCDREADVGELGRKEIGTYCYDCSYRGNDVVCRNLATTALSAAEFHQTSSIYSDFM